MRLPSRSTLSNLRPTSIAGATMTDRNTNGDASRKPVSWRCPNNAPMRSTYRSTSGSSGTVASLGLDTVDQLLESRFVGRHGLARASHLEEVLAARSLANHAE